MGRYRAIDEAHLLTLWREGRGRGEGADYTPMITVRDVPSRGQSARVRGWTTGRTHHLLTKLEQAYFACADWSRSVIDIREHFPLLTTTEIQGKIVPTIADTKAIAARLGLAHPCSASTGSLRIVTVDFVLTCRRAGQRVEVARSLTKTAALARPAVTHRLDLVRTWCEDHGLEWGLVTDQEIPWGLVQNVQLVRASYHLPERNEIPPDHLALYAEALTARRLEHPEESLATSGIQCDRQFSLPPGTGLAIAYYLIATRQWAIDMYTPIRPGRPLALRAVALESSAEERGLGCVYAKTC
jgi:TnsA endonuclease C terminal